MSDTRNKNFSENNTTTELAKCIYNDGGKPVVSTTGKLLELVPRAIKAALYPVEKWVLQKEYNLEETRKLLEEKLKNVPPQNIQSPEPYIAVPALQYISICMDNVVLKDMYANLLANSMTSIVKNGVHPAFVEIIKQLSPDEAKILKYFFSHEQVPTITLSLENEKGEYQDVVKNFSNIGELTQCEFPLEVNKYFGNLIRLGLLANSIPNAILTEREIYESLKKHSYILSKMNEPIEEDPTLTKPRFTEGFIFLTDFGKSFCDICLYVSGKE